MKSFKARDNTELYFEYYPSESNVVMILLHGISEDHKYLSPFAQYVANEKLAHVYTPDLRGYGTYSKQKGDIDYIGQHEDDLMDFIEWINHVNDQPSIIIAGHSAGGGTAIRFAQSPYDQYVQGYLLLAPFVHPNAPTTPKKNENSNSSVKLSKLIPLIIFNGVNITKYNHWKVYFNNKPEELRHGRETLELSYRLLFSRFPTVYEKALKALRKPTLVLIGEEDEEFESSQYNPLFAKYTDAETHLIKGANHDGILSNEETFLYTKQWMLALSK